MMVLAGDMEEADDMYECLSVLALEDDEAEEDRRNEVRMFMGEKRAVIWWKRDDCMVTTCFGKGLYVSSSLA